MKPCFLLLFIIVSCKTSAQSLLTPSKNSFEKKWVKSSSYEMAWFTMKDTARKEIGRVNTQILVNKKTLTVVTEVKMKSLKSPWIDSTIADIRTLRSIKHSSYNLQRDMVLNFGKIVSGYYNNKMKKTITSISDTTDAEYFDSNLYPVLVGWLSLKNGYKQDISIYDYNPSGKIGIIKASVDDVSSGTCETEKSGVRDVWIVTVSDEIGNGENGVSTYYFDKETRKLWKQEINANGRKMLLKLIEQ